MYIYIPECKSSWKPINYKPFDVIDLWEDWLSEWIVKTQDCLLEVFNNQKPGVKYLQWNKPKRDIFKFTLSRDYWDAFDKFDNLRFHCKYKVNIQLNSYTCYRLWR